eukprot:scaffold155674_cov19-Tisochrysis_lutea.AAC.2
MHSVKLKGQPTLKFKLPSTSLPCVLQSRFQSAVPACLGTLVEFLCVLYLALHVSCLHAVDLLGEALASLLVRGPFLNARSQTWPA